MDLSTLIMDYIKSSLWNEFILFMDFISPSTLIIDPSTCGPNHEPVHLWDELVLFMDFMNSYTCGLYDNNSSLWDELVHSMDLIVDLSTYGF